MMTRSRGRLSFVRLGRQLNAIVFCFPLRAGKRVTVNALHPGVVQTDFLRFDRFLNKAAQFTSFLFMKVSDTPTHTDDDVVTG